MVSWNYCAVAFVTLIDEPGLDFVYRPTDHDQGTWFSESVLLDLEMPTVDGYQYEIVETLVPE